MARIECWLGSFVILTRFGPVFLGNPIHLRFFRGGGVRTPCLPFWIRACSSATTPFGVTINSLLKPLVANIYPVINVKIFLAICVVILLNIAFTAVEMLHEKDQG